MSRLDPPPADAEAPAAPATPLPPPDERSDDLDAPLPPASEWLPAGLRPPPTTTARRGRARTGRRGRAASPSDEGPADFDDFLYDADELYDPEDAGRPGGHDAPLESEIEARWPDEPTTALPPPPPAPPSPFADEGDPAAAGVHGAPDDRPGPARPWRPHARPLGGQLLDLRPPAAGQPPQGPRGGGLGSRRRRGGLPAVSRRRLAALACSSTSSPRCWRSARSTRRRRRRPATAPALTVRQAVGQHMIFAYDGLQPPPALRRRIARGEAAGVILFARNVRSAGQVRAAMRSLQAIRRPRGPARAADRHGRPGGRAGAAHPRRARRAPRRASTSAAQARADGRAAARTLRSAGREHEPRAGRRRRAARRGAGARAAHVRPLRGRRRAARGRVRRAACATGGVRATAKHFPGFGAAARQHRQRAAADRHLAGRRCARVDARAVQRAGRRRRRRGHGLDRRLSGARRAAGGVLARLGRRRAARAPGLPRREHHRRPRHAGRRGVRLEPPARGARRRRRASTCRCSRRATAPARRPPRACSPRRAAARLDAGALREQRRGACCALRAQHPALSDHCRTCAAAAAPGAAGGIDRVAVTARRLDERDVGARRARRRGVLARALDRRPSRRRRACTSPTGTPSGMRRIGSACAQRSGTSSGVAAEQLAAPARPARSEVADRRQREHALRAATRGRRAAARRPAARRRAGRPQRELAARRVAEQRHASRSSAASSSRGEVVDRRRDVVERLRPAAALRPSRRYSTFSAA